jgi:hypothetical protein
MNGKLRDHLTRAFSLSLGHHQCRGLVAIHAAGPLPSEVVLVGLTVRGLIRETGTEEEPEAVLTKAGSLIVGLIQEAGLYDYYAPKESD